MTLASPKGSSTMTAFPRSLSTILVSVGGLAMFLIFASWLLVSNPIGSTVRGYFYGVDGSKNIELPVVPPNKTTIDHALDSTVDDFDKNSQSGPQLELPNNTSSTQIHSRSQESVNSTVKENKSDGTEGSDDANKSDGTEGSDDSTPATSSENKSGGTEGSDDTTAATSSEHKSSGADKASDETTPASSSSDSKEAALSSLVSDANKTGSGDSDCDLYHGSWFYDSAGPLYTNNSCPVITQMQNCQGNGRPDREYENWRWKPSQCDLSRFDAKKFLELMRGKTLAFIGDSVARNQMESMLCLLWQVEVPKNRGNRRMQRWFFRSTNTMIVRIWSSWLIHRTSEPFDFAPESVVKLHLDAPDGDFMNYITQFDVIVLSSGHWFAKQSVYMLNNEVVGGQLWWPHKSRQMKVNNIDAFGISVETILTAMVTHLNYTGLTIVRSFSPDHYEGGAWNAGGSCTGKVKPLAPGELVENGFTDIMHKKQVMGFDRASKKQTNKSKLKLMDITEVFGYRHDGHPGPYRSPDPNKITKRGPDGKPPPQDCLHWCMPGPVDTWNELVLEIIRREFEDNQSFIS